METGTLYKFRGSGHIWELEEPIEGIDGKLHYYLRLKVRDPKATNDDDRGVGYRTRIELYDLDRAIAVGTNGIT